MAGRIPTLRVGALLAAGALAVHEIRYVAGYGSGADHALDVQGHAYLTLAWPIIGLLLALGLARFVVAVIGLRRADGGAIGRRPADGETARLALPVLWLGSTVCLSAVYVLQELLEGVLAPGHPAGLAGIVGHGGWVAFVVALAAGLLVALLLRGADAAIAAAATRRARRSPRATRPSPPRPRTVDLIRPAPLAGSVAGRAPPFTS